MWLVDQLYIKLEAEGPGSETLSCEDHNLIRGNLQLLCYIAKEHDHPNIITTDMAHFPCHNIFTIKNELQSIEEWQ